MILSVFNSALLLDLSAEQLNTEELKLTSTRTHAHKYTCREREREIESEREREREALMTFNNCTYAAIMDY